MQVPLFRLSFRDRKEIFSQRRTLLLPKRGHKHAHKESHIILV